MGSGVEQPGVGLVQGGGVHGFFVARPYPERVPPTPPHRPANDPCRDVVVAAAALVDRLDRPTRVLAARRVSPSELRGRWEFPGGKVEAGEGPREAVVRELREELGVAVRLGPRVPGPGPDGSWPLRPGLRLLLWLATTPDRPRPLAEHDAVRWLGAGSISTVAWLESNRAVVAAVRDLLTATAAPGG